MQNLSQSSEQPQQSDMVDMDRMNDEWFESVQIPYRPIMEDLIGNFLTESEQ